MSHHASARPGRARPTGRPDASDALSDPPSPAERATLATFDAQRRLHLLRLTVPPLLVVVLLALPFAIQADRGTHSLTSSLQAGVGLVAFAVSFVATRIRRVNLAAAALFTGITGVIVLLLLTGGPLHGSLDLTATPAFALFVLPIAVAGVFGAPRFVVLATAGSVAFTLAVLLLTPHAPALRAVVAQPDGLAIFTIPLATQIATGILIYAATRGFHRTQRELGDVRVAYARERELDRLKDQLISSVNHELRTPIMALQGYIELARALGERGELAQQAQMLRRGAEAVNHLAAVVASALDVRRIEADAGSIQPTAVPLRPLLTSAANLLDPREAGPEQRSLRLSIADDVAVLADESRLRQVVLNLLSNACKYSPPGSPIDVTVRVLPPPVRRLRGRHDAVPPMVEVAIRDYGLGIPPEQIVLLFQRFVRLERDIASPIAGTGLGLAICRAYVEAMDGRIWVESSGLVGAGSTFLFTLPLAPVPSPTPVEPASTSSTSSTSSTTLPTSSEPATVHVDRST
jgi:signal transduction histidine kinase